MSKHQIQDRDQVAQISKRRIKGFGDLENTFSVFWVVTVFLFWSLYQNLTEKLKT